MRGSCRVRSQQRSERYWSAHGGAMVGGDFGGIYSAPRPGTIGIKEIRMRLTDFKALTFDCYGTLIDWETGMIEALKPLTGRLAKPPSRNQVLQAHARHESDQQAQTPGKLYRDLLAIVYRRLAEEWGISAPWSECVAYGQSVRDWPAFADSAAALQYLKMHYKLVILSNVDNESFSFSSHRLGVAFDAVYTAEDIGSYKPSLGNFQYML